MGTEGTVTETAAVDNGVEARWLHRFIRDHPLPHNASDYMHRYALERPAVYVSTPITSGASLVGWLRQAKERGLSHEEALLAATEVKADVVAQNRQTAAPIVERVRHLTGRSVIDPTTLEDVPGWKQGDYHRFWVAVILEYCDTVVFAPEWEYSNGCSIEFAAAVCAGLTTLNAKMLPLQAEEGLKSLEVAIDKMESAGLPTAILRASHGAVKSCHDASSIPSR